MIFVVLLICALVVGIVLFLKFKKFYFGELIATSILIGLFASFIVSLSADSHVVVSNEVEIYSLKDNFSSSSSFILGTGSSKSNLKYHYFVNGDNGLEYQSILASDVSIQFDDSPRLIIYENQFKNKSLGFWFCNLNGSYKVLYIPENTIYQDISIDLE